MIDLQGKSALVTGGSRGIGKACSTLLARAGARTRNPLDALVASRLAAVSRRRRDRPPEAEVAAVRSAVSTVISLSRTG